MEVRAEGVVVITLEPGGAVIIRAFLPCPTGEDGVGVTMVGTELLGFIAGPGAGRIFLRPPGLCVTLTEVCGSPCGAVIYPFR